MELLIIIFLLMTIILMLVILPILLPILYYVVKTIPIVVGGFASLIYDAVIYLFDCIENRDSG